MIFHVKAHIYEQIKFITQNKSIFNTTWQNSIKSASYRNTRHPVLKSFFHCRWRNELRHCGLFHDLCLTQQKRNSYLGKEKSYLIWYWYWILSPCYLIYSHIVYACSEPQSWWHLTMIPKKYWYGKLKYLPQPLYIAYHFHSCADPGDISISEILFQVHS